MIDDLLQRASKSVTAAWAKNDQKVLDKQILRSGIQEVADIPYGEEAGQTLDVYFPQERTSPLPVLLHFHGGGFFYGDKSQDRAFGYEMAARGFLVVNCGYRLTNGKVKVWHQLQDCAKGAQWLESHLTQYGGDPERVFLSGGSAGAVFAVLLAVLENDDSMRRCYNVPETSLHYKGIFSTCGFFKYDSKRTAFRCQRRICFGKGWKSHPMYQRMLWRNLSGLSQLPPVFLISGHDDWLKSMTLFFDRLLTHCCVPHKLLFLPKGRGMRLDHLITIMRPDLPACQMALDSAADYLQSINSEHPDAREKRIQEGSHFLVKGM